MSRRRTPRPLRSAADLVAAGLVAPDAAAEIEQVTARYAMALTPDVAALIDPADPADPIARQFIPGPDELETAPGERADPIGDDAFSPLPGLVHRYPDRVLLKPIMVCPVYCRFCFRRESVADAEATLSSEQIAAALDYIGNHPEIWEVILTGGDPLMLPPRRLGALLDSLQAIAHVRVVRLHSRVPVVDPGRVGAALAQALDRERPVWLAVHANHAREFSAAACAALARLRRAGVVLVGQSVLLQGINDDAASLTALFRAMVENGIKPYYLHHGDMAPGTARFRTTLEHGRALMRALRGQVSGLALPAYVLDIPGGYGKVAVGPDALAEQGMVMDRHGRLHPYPPG